MRRHPVNRWTKEHIGGPRYIEVRDEDKILVIENTLHRQIKFRVRLPPTAKIVSRVDRALREIEAQRFDLIFLDRDLDGGGFGEDIATHLAAIKFPGKVICHSDNHTAAQFIKKILDDGGVNVEIIPFGILGVFRNPTMTTEVAR
jgi:Cyclic-phosphate processing Receiver domain